ncbi:hypothetical protein [Thiorhodococcus fuscus]|uniref:Uncharacterized protein n=1 Tax=Thiorhodococcus fuscus TaxID=527200 RepID=A0ABW4Y821_9GAMM
MEPRWLSYLDAHIARGMVATEAESADTLSWLLKLEPEQRWCLLLRRDPCLKRLVADDYRRILTLMVELEADALSEASTSTEPCVDPGSLPSSEHRFMIAPLHQEQESSLGRRSTARLRPTPWILTALTLVGAAAGLWLFVQHEGHRVQDLAQTTVALQGNVERRLTELDQVHRQVVAAVRDIDRQRHATQSLLALSDLSEKLTAGQPFVSELAGLEAVWSEPAQLEFLKPLAEQGIATPATLISELTRLNETLDQRNSVRFDRRTPYGPASAYPYYPAFAATGVQQARSQAGTKALEQARAGHWQAAIDILRKHGDSVYRDWIERVGRWLATYRQLADLRQRVWSRGSDGLAASTSRTATSPPP